MVLPPGWKREVHVRKSGKSKGLCDVYFFSPKGLKFRSRISLAKYIKEEALKITIEDFDFKEESSNVKKTSVKKEKSTKKAPTAKLDKDGHVAISEAVEEATTAQLDEHNAGSEAVEEADNSEGNVNEPDAVSVNDETGPDCDSTDTKGPGEGNKPQDGEGTSYVNLKRKSLDALSELSDKQEQNEEIPARLIPVPKKRKADTWNTCRLL